MFDDKITNSVQITATTPHGFYRGGEHSGWIRHRDADTNGAYIDTDSSA